MNKRFIKYVVGGLMVIFLFSCVTNRTTRYLQEGKESYEKGSFEDYRIMPNDLVTFLVLSPDKETTDLFSGGTNNGGMNSYSYRVYSDSTIDIPFMHKVKIAGLTIRDARNRLQERLKDYIPGQFFVKLVLNNRSYYVLGESNSKGEFPIYKDRMNIFEALAQSGDIAQTANYKKVHVMRNINGKDSLLTFDIRSKSIVDSKYYYLQPNDLIYMEQPKNGFFKITSFSSFLGVISSTVSFVLLVITYSSK